MQLRGADETRIQQEVTAIVNTLSDLTGLSSRWNGDVELSHDTRTFGRKPFSCRIVLNQQLADNPIRWRTLIHEALHSFSAGYTMSSYQMFLGWEEAVVEQTQRLLRPAVLERIGIQTNAERNKFVAIFSEANSILKESPL